jgi:Fe-S-cluster containining protein
MVMKCQRCGCCCLGANEGLISVGILKIRITAEDLAREPQLKKEVEDGYLQTPCPFLEFAGDVAVCQIYTTRPQVCANYPPRNTQAVALGYPCALKEK